MPDVAGHPEIYFRQVGDYDLAIRDAGAGEGLPLVLIHGFGGSINSWFLTQNALAAGRRVIAFDLPGHGSSCLHVGEGTLRAFASIVSHMLTEMELPRVHLMGHSLGGGIALSLAQLRPDQAASLSLIAPAALGAEVNAEFLYNFIEADDPAAMRLVLEKLVAAKILIGRKAVEDVLSNHNVAGVREALHHIVNACFDGSRQRQILRSVFTTTDIPAQVIWGVEDAILPASHGQGLSPRVTVHFLEGAGHMPQLEKAAEVNALIRSFLMRAEAEAGL
ncbi:alpha/beta fold hydrolase [Acetobacter thailandicus]|uniref:alpha/beta fold hydrolase n=1 Tax=Acetobacter thailandicus TaxID=1502842 RepID=UPI001BA5D45A|nr:alpha/beta fold hydrolase [Acetobacter thailandicus]MBS1002954.1 alpha/beta fold hydrolase [Acetobacter thailandicus]